VAIEIGFTDDDNGPDRRSARGADNYNNKYFY
jgi:hypothetical protein